MSSKSHSSRSKSHHSVSEGHDRDNGERDKRKKKSKKRDRDDNDGDNGDERRDYSHSRSRSRSSRKNVVDSNSEGDVVADDRSDLSNNNHHRDRDGRSGGRSHSHSHSHSRHSSSSSKAGHRDRHSSSREKSSNKRRKKSSRSRSGSGKHYSDDDNSDHSSDYDNDRRRSNDRKKKKKSSQSRHEKKDKKSSVKKPDKSKMVSMGEPFGRSPDSKVNAEEDYFSYHNEFWIYLFREEGTCFNDIDNDESRAAFARFAKQYNAGMLEEPYYTRTFPNEVIEESKTTKHSWGFKTTHRERKGLGDLQKGVRRQTEYSSSKDPTKTANNHQIDVRKVKSTTHSSQVIRQPSNSNSNRNSNPAPRPTPEERRNEKRADDRRWKDRVRLTQDELTGGHKDGKERQLEKKREHAGRIHGAHRDHEVEAAGMELSDAALFGNDGDGGSGSGSRGSVLGRHRQKKERKDERQRTRIQELQQKEDERKNNMLKMLGLENLQGKKKLVIAPRK